MGMSNDATVQMLTTIAELQHRVADLAQRLASLNGLAVGLAGLGMVEGQSCNDAGDGLPTGAPTPVVPDEGTLPERVLGYLRQQPGVAVKRKVLNAAFAGINQNSMSGALTRLKDRGEVEAVGRGRYRATTSDRGWRRSAS